MQLQKQLRVRDCVLELVASVVPGSYDGSEGDFDGDDVAASLDGHLHITNGTCTLNNYHRNVSLFIRRLVLLVGNCVVTVPVHRTKSRLSNNNIFQVLFVRTKSQYVQCQPPLKAC